MTTLTVGTGQQFSTISAAVAAANPGDTIDVQAGTYTNDFPQVISGLMIQGVGGTASLVATTAPPNGKAIFDVAGNTTLKNLDFSGVAAPDGNGAGVRYESGNLVVQNSSFHGNQDGLLGGPDPSGSITIDQSEFYDNGTPSGFTHNMYIGDIAQFTITNSYIHDANTGHEIKSRAANNTIANNRIDGNSGNGSYEIDLPNGGNATIAGNVIQKSANSGNHVSVSYGEEGSQNAGASLVVTNNTFITDGSGAFVLNDAANLPVTAAGNTVWNYSSSQIDKSGHVSSSGFSALSARPALDASSPITSAGTSPGSSTGDPSSGSSGPSDTGSPVPPPPSPPAPPPPPSDTTAPTLSAAEDHSGVSDQASVVISGLASDAGAGVARVEVYDMVGGVRTDLGSATLASDGSWRFTASSLADGSHSFSAVATDSAGNATGAVSAGAAVIVETAVAPPVDTAAPSLTTAQSVAGVTTQTSNVLSGTVSDAGSGVARVEVYDTVGGNTVDLGSATIDDGNWSFTASDLGVGDHYFSAAATDQAGNATQAIYVGTPQTVIAPNPTPAPTVTIPAIQSFASNGDGSFTFGGVAPSGSAVTLFDGAGHTTTIIGTTTSGDNGAWAVTTSGVDTNAVNRVVALSGNQVPSLNAFTVASAGPDTLSGIFGQNDVFAFASNFGQDVIRGFETTEAVGANHDVINLTATGYGSFDQIKPQIAGSSAAVIDLNNGNTITLAGVSAASLSASDFRFS